MRRGLTILEMIIATALLGLFTVVAWQGYTGGTKETTTSDDYLNAMQNAMVLMESIQEDVRQMAILNVPGKPLIPRTLKISPSGKAIMFRKSSSRNTDGKMAGSSFTVVMYQMVKHPTIPDVYTIRRVERTTDGEVIPGTGREEDERIFKLLYLRDIRFDVLVMFGNMTNYRTFIRVSATATNAGEAKADPRVYMITNMFETISPEYIHNKPGIVGFARRFMISPVDLQGAEVLPGNGYDKSLPPVEFTDFTGGNLPDFLDTDGVMKNLPGAPPASGTNPFVSTGFTAAPLRQKYIRTACEYLDSVLGQFYRGRIPGQVLQRLPPNSTAQPWVESFTLDCSSSTPIANQLNDVLTRMMARGPEAVEDLGHTFYSYTYENGIHPDGSISYMVKPEDAEAIMQGR